LALPVALVAAVLDPAAALAEPEEKGAEASRSGVPGSGQGTRLDYDRRAKRRVIGRSGGALLTVGAVGAAVSFLPPMLDSDAGRIVGPLSTAPLVLGLGLLVRYRTLKVDAALTKEPRRRPRKRRRLLGFGWGFMAAGAGLFVAGWLEGSFGALIIMPTIGGGLGLLGTGLLIRGYRVARVDDPPVEVRLGPTGVALRGRF
jgi:peptidoglycan/LPS O-acetylase OafA/YrhL